MPTPLSCPPLPPRLKLPRSHLPRDPGTCRSGELPDAWIVYKVIVGGESLNEERGYSEVFGWRLLGGQPFYFFKQGGRLGMSYADAVLPYRYADVIHYRCCEPAALNVAGNETMIWFHALRDGVWHYVEAGVYGGEPASQPTATTEASQGAPALRTGTIEEARKARRRRVRAREG